MYITDLILLLLLHLPVWFTSWAAGEASATGGKICLKAMRVVVVIVVVVLVVIIIIIIIVVGVDVSRAIFYNNNNNNNDIVVYCRYDGWSYIVVVSRLRLRELFVNGISVQIVGIRIFFSTYSYE